MNVVAIVQARMGSTRLPGKVMEDLSGKPVLDRVIEAVHACAMIDRVVVATTELPEDDVLARHARALGAGVVRGDTHDVLERYRVAAAESDARVVVRLTADCPLLDPAVVGAVVAALGPDVDYASNTHTRSFPRGLDVEAFHVDTLQRLARLARSPSAREHVTAFVLERPDLFAIRQVVATSDDSDLRVTVDTPADLVVVRAIWAALGTNRRPPGDEVVAFLRGRPDLRALNSDVVQTSWRDAERMRPHA